MQLSNTPLKLTLPFSSTGLKVTIPEASQVGITPGAASLTDGFPPLTRTPLASGGVPVRPEDMNGVLYEMSAIDRWAVAGGGYAFDSTFANNANVGGYPKGARVMRSDGLGYWLNTTENNITDPESSPVGWAPDFTSGITSVTMTNANVTLTPLQYGKPIIVIAGVLTANLNLIFPAIAGEWTVANGTSGAFTVTCKTVSGTGIAVSQGVSTLIYGNATDIADVVGTAVTSTNDATFANNSVKPASTSWVRGAMQAIATAAGFVINASANGHIKFPSWLGSFIIQWGSWTPNATTGAAVAVSFSMTFPNAAYSLVTTVGGQTSTSIQGSWWDSFVVTGFNGHSNQTAGGCSYIAIGK